MDRTLSPAATAACAYAERWQKGTRVISDASLEMFANKFLDDLSRHAPIIDRFSRGTGSMLARAIHGYRISFAKTGKDNCLDVYPSNGQIVVNREFMDAIASRALNSYASIDLREGAHVRRLLRTAIRSAIRMIVGHELFHPEQGLPTIGVVRRAALAVGWDEVAKLDVDADFRAAAVEASLSAVKDGSIGYAHVLRRMEDALAFQLRYCIPVFRCPSDKPHKQSRVAGLVMQLGRIVYANRLGKTIDEIEYRSLTMPVYVRVDKNYSNIGITGIDPPLFLGSIQFDMGELKPFFSALDSGDVEWLVQEAITLNMRIGLIAI